MVSMGGMLDPWQQLERWADRHTVGVRGKARLVSARADSVRQAIRLSEGLAVYWILRDFRDLNLQGVVNDIVEVLRQCLIVMLTTTGGGALIGGIAGGIGGVGAGAVPGVVIGAGAGAQVGEWILIAMGLKALAEYVVNDMPGIARDYWAGIHQAWQAATAPPLPQQPVRIDQLALHHAAEKIARAHVAVFVLLLMGIVAYLAKGRGSMADLAESVRGSKAGPRFAEWLVRNEGKLKAEPRLKAKVTDTLKEPPTSATKSSGPATRPSRLPSSKPALAAEEKPPFRGTVKYRSAEDVNSELFDRGIADPKHPPFKAGTQVSERTMMPGEKINMLIDDKQLRLLQDPISKHGLGGWGSSESFQNQSQGLARMAITTGQNGFKPNGVQYQVELEVRKPIRVLEGRAGSQGKLPGGGQQTFLDVMPAARRDALGQVKITPLPKP